MSTWNYEWIPRDTLKRTDSMEVLTGREGEGDVGENEIVCREKEGDPIVLTDKRITFNPIVITQKYRVDRVMRKHKRWAKKIIMAKNYGIW